MINRYNIFIWSLLTFLVCFAIYLCLLTVRNKLDEMNLHFIVAFLLNNIIIVAIFSIFIFIINAIYGSIKSPLNNELNSYLGTFRLRRFAHFETEKLSFDLSNRTITPQKTIINKANRSLLTLTLTYDKNEVRLRWKLPANHESQKKLKELFPSIKTELQTIDPSISFTDITNKKGRWYHAKGYYL